MDPRAMVLCAGLGTRLRPLTDELPKPLVPLGDRPLLLHIADRLARAGHAALVLNAHHLHEVFVREVGLMKRAFRVVCEDEIRGTAGGVRGALGLLGEPPILVWNGDILADVDPADLLVAAGEGLAFAVAPRARGEGTVGLGPDGSVVRLRGEAFGPEEAGGDFVGVSAFGRGALALLPERGCLVADVALPWLRSGGRISSSPAGPEWTDLGSISAYHAANLAWLARRGEAAFVHPEARVAPGVAIVGSVVGAGASIGGSGTIARSVVWPGAVASAPLSDSIVTSSGRVVPAS